MKASQIILAIGGALFATLSPVLAQITDQSLISRGQQGLGNGASHCAALSGDGRFTIFESDASNLVSGDTNSRSDLFLHDASNGQLKRISQTAAGAEQKGGENPTTCSSALARDGNTAIYATDGAGLVESAQTVLSRIYAIDTRSNSIELLTPAILDEGVYFPSVNQDASKIVFVSNSKSIHPKANGLFQVYLLERPSNRITLVTQDAAGNAANGASDRAEISHNGEWIAFSSVATNLKGAEISGVDVPSQIFTHNIQSSSNLLVSKDPSSRIGDADSFGSHLSADGKIVVFYTSAHNLLGSNDDSEGAALLFDRERGSLEAISVDNNGARLPGFQELLGNALSADGNLVMFRSLLGRFKKFRIEVYVRDRSAGRTYLSSFSKNCSFGAQGGASHSGSLAPDVPRLAFAVGKDTARSPLQVVAVGLDVLRQVGSAPSEVSAPDADICGAQATLAFSPFDLLPSAGLRESAAKVKDSDAGQGISYEADIKRAGVSADRKRLLTKRNVVTLSKLEPGTYSARYRVVVNDSNGTRTRSASSAATTFRISP